MKIIIEEEDWINAVQIDPDRINGCNFRALFLQDGSVRIEYGCYHLTNLQTGANRYIQGLIRANGDAPIEIPCSPELKNKLLSLKYSCVRCGAPWHELKTPPKAG